MGLLYQLKDTLLEALFHLGINLVLGLKRKHIAQAAELLPEE